MVYNTGELHFIRKLIKRMSNINLRIPVLTGLLIWATSIPSPAGILFTEDWNAGSIDGNKWTVGFSRGGQWDIVDVGGGDYAVKGYAEGQYDTSIVSKLVFIRGENLRVTFKVWGDAAQTGKKMKFPERSTIIGPWHSSFYDYCAGFTLEAGLNAAAGQKTNNFRFSENGIQHAFGRPLPDKEEFSQSWMKASSKENALTLRVTLGERTGSKFEWMDGDEWHTSIDTRGNPATLGGQIGSAATVKVGFNPFAMPILVDDIVVENDASSSEKDLAPYISNRKPVIKEEATPWTNLNFNNNPDNFQFAIISDFTGQIRPGLVKETMKKLNLLQPEFVMSVGDLIEGCPVNKDFTRQQFEELDSWVAPLQMPFFYVPGNHDIANKEMREVWRERYGKDYYHFVYRKVLFVCLDVNEIAWGRISDKQIEWLAGVLEANRDVRWTLVFIHDPLWEYDWGDYETGWDKVEALLRDRPYNVFAGHYHFYAKFNRHNTKYYILSRTAVLPSNRFKNEMNCLVWVTMTDEGPLLANLPIMEIYDENLATEEDAREELDRWRKFMRKHVTGSIGRYKENCLFKKICG